MFDQGSAHALAYGALDQVLADGFVHPSSRQAMFSVVDDLRSRSAAADTLRRAESISVEFHKLECAARLSDGAAKRASIEELRNLAVQWLDARIAD